MTCRLLKWKDVLAVVVLKCSYKIYTGKLHALIMALLDVMKLIDH